MPPTEGLRLRRRTGIGPAAERWPLIGRREGFVLALEAVAGARPGALIVSGAAGVGKSRLLAEAADAAAERGWLVVRAVAAEGSSSIPFRALAGLLPVDAPRPVSELSLLHQAAAQLRGRARGRALLLVDDAHQLDASSLTLLFQSRNLSLRLGAAGVALREPDATLAAGAVEGRLGRPR